MKFRFSVQSLFILTTVVAVLMGIAMWLKLVNHWRFVVIFVSYLVVYLFVAGLFLGPRYLREWREFREKRSSQLLLKASLEEEVREKLKIANEKKRDQDSEQEPD